MRRFPHLPRSSPQNNENPKPIASRNGIGAGLNEGATALTINH